MHFNPATTNLLFNLCRGTLFLLVFGFFVPFQSFSQDKNGALSFKSIDQALIVPDETSHLSLLVSEENIRKFLASPKPFRNLVSIKITGDATTQGYLILLKNLSEIPNLKEIEIQSENFDHAALLVRIKTLQKIILRGSPKLDYKLFLDHLKTLPELKSLSFENNSLSKIPKNIAELEKLSELKIASNPSLNFKTTLKYIAGMPSLTELYLPQNELSEIPSTLEKCQQLELLDLKSNNLTILSAELASLKKLKTLHLEGNYIADPVSELEKAKNPGLKLLTLDRGILEEDLLEIKKIFPVATIKEIDTFTDNEFIYTDASDSTQLSAADVLKVQKVLAQKIDTGTFRIQRNEIKALSNAYLYYPKLFDSRKFDYEFDSLLFDVRYSDTTYSGVWKIQPNQKYPNIVLEKYGMSPKGEVWFDFSRAMGYNRYLVKNNPEINAFIGMKWVYLGELNRKEFRKAFIKNKMWLDTRIYYDEPNKNFSIELKDKNGFASISAYPRNPDLRNPLENSQKMYAKRNERYLKVLQRREDKFHKTLFKEKVKYEKLYDNREAKLWEVFRSQMSNKERAMSKSEWLSYYDEIIREEKKALYSSVSTAGNLLRSLEIEGYKIIPSIEQAMNNQVKETQVSFFDEKSKKIADAQIFLIAPGKKEIYTYEGNMGTKETPMYLDFTSNYKIVVESRSGHLAICSEENLQKLDLKNSKTISLSTSVHDKNLTSVGQIWRELGLE